MIHHTGLSNPARPQKPLDKQISGSGLYPNTGSSLLSIYHGDARPPSESKTRRCLIFTLSAEYQRQIQCLAKVVFQTMLLTYF